MQYQAETQTYIATVDDSFDNRIEIEVGDSKQPDAFYPQLKIMRWDNEVNLSIRLIDTQTDTPVIEQDVDIVAYKRADLEANFYKLHPTQQLEDGGHEFEVILNSKPVSNIIQYSVKSKGLRFLYQHDPTPEEIAELGLRRPENVVGSYAVYCSDPNKKHNRVGGKSYKTGKFCHIYRPWALDANGVKVWCELFIDADNEIATITLPQDFVDTAAYPVLVDPTFGYTSVGSTNTNLNNHSYASRFNLTENATVTKISMCVTSSTPLTVHSAPAIYYDDETGGILPTSSDTSAPSKFILDGSSQLTTSGSPPAFVDSTITSTPLTVGAYWLAVMSDADGNITDAGIQGDTDPSARNCYGHASGTTYHTWETNYVFWFHNGLVNSIYATYTVGGVIGHKYVENTSQQTFWNGLIVASKTVVTASEDGASFSIYLGGGNTTDTVDLAVYTDNAGVPNALVANSTKLNVVVPSVDGWVTVNYSTAPSFSSGSTYWLAVVFKFSNTAWYEGPALGSTDFELVYAVHGSPPPATFPTSTSLGNIGTGIYILTQAGGGTITPYPGNYFLNFT